MKLFCILLMYLAQRTSSVCVSECPRWNCWGSGGCHPASVCRASCSHCPAVWEYGWQTSVSEAVWSPCLRSFLEKSCARWCCFCVFLLLLFVCLFSCLVWFVVFFGGGNLGRESHLTCMQCLHANAHTHTCTHTHTRIHTHTRMHRHACVHTHFLYAE